MSELLQLLASVWSLHILRLLSRKAHHFSALKRGVSGISAKVLTTRLRELERHGLVARKVIPSSPPTVQYELTALGARVGAFVEQLETMVKPVTDAAKKEAQGATVQLVALSS